MTHDYSFYEQILREIEYKEYESRIAACSGDYFHLEKRFNPYHDDKGRFAKASESSSKPLTSRKNCVKLDKKGKPFEYPQLHLPPKEYGKVMHEINTVYHSKYINKNKCWLTLAKTTYFFENHGFDDYNIFDKRKD